MKDEFDAKMLGRVGSGQLTGAMSLKRTVQLACARDVLQLGWRHTIRHRTRGVAWTYGHSSCDEDTNTGTEGN